MKLRSQLVVSHMVSIVVVAVVLGSVNLAILLRNTRSMEQLTLERSLALAGQLLLSRHAAMEHGAADIGTFVASHPTLGDDVRTLAELHRRLDLYGLERVEVFLGLHREADAYRWERGANPALATQWLPQNPRLSAQIAGGRAATWVQTSPGEEPALKFCFPVPGELGENRRWVVISEPLDPELLERLGPVVPVAGFSQGTRRLVSLPANDLDDDAMFEGSLSGSLLARVLKPVSAERPVLRLDDGSSLSVYMQDAPLLSGQTLLAGVRSWLLIVIGALLIAGVLGSGLAARLLAPLRALLEGTAAMARGHLMVRLKATRRDEIGALTREFNRMADEISATYLGVISTLAEVVEAKSEYTRKHIERVEQLALATAEVLERRGFVHFSSHQRFLLSVAAILHDVGKISIASEILNKAGPLDHSERDKILSHPEIGALIVERMGKLEAAAEIIRCAHEHYDGSGYPRGLSGDEIPLESRIILAVDAFDAMTGDRPYSSGRSVPEALAELDRHSGRQFDPVVVSALAEVITIGGASGTAPSSDSGLVRLLQPASTTGETVLRPALPMDRG